MRCRRENRAKVSSLRIGGEEEEGEEDRGATSSLSTTLTAGKEAYETAHLAERDVEANER